MNTHLSSLYGASIHLLLRRRGPHTRFGLGGGRRRARGEAEDAGGRRHCGACVGEDRRARLGLGARVQLADGDWHGVAPVSAAARGLSVDHHPRHKRVRRDKRLRARKRSSLQLSATRAGGAVQNLQRVHLSPPCAGGGGEGCVARGGEVSLKTHGEREPAVHSVQGQRAHLHAVTLALLRPVLTFKHGGGRRSGVGFHLCVSKWNKGQVDNVEKPLLFHRRKVVSSKHRAERA
mmetsp:Transcript_39526/g.75738  ORF Transcript_39526/g.75738 Transcript_39526/m.75738 type:complete len:234 (-) Transcript_39526:189-890(-)